MNDRKKLCLSKEIEEFFVFSNLTARILRTTLAGMMYCTSFESPDIQFLGARRTEGVASKQSRHAPLSEKSSNFIQEGVAALFVGHVLCPSGSKELNIRAFK